MVSDFSDGADCTTERNPNPLNQRSLATDLGRAIFDLSSDVLSPQRGNLMSAQDVVWADIAPARWACHLSKLIRLHGNPSIKNQSPPVFGLAERESRQSETCWAALEGDVPDAIGILQ